MSYLETKRNAIMNAIASGQLTNLLANCTWARGFFDGNGGISSAGSTTKEKYENEYIEVDTTDEYVWVLKFPTPQSAWVGYCEYQQDETFVTRRNPISGSNIISTYVFRWKINNPKIRVSLRTYGNCEIGLYSMQEIYNLIDNSEITKLQD